MQANQSNGQQANVNVPRRSRKGSVSPFCRVTGKSISMEDHHYIPSWEDYQQHGSPYRCRITEKNKYFKDYKYVYPIIDADGTTRMITEHDFHCRITSKYRAMAGYKYIYPLLGSSTDKTKKDMSSVMEDPLLKDVLVPKEVEQIIRGGIEDVLRLNESEYLYIISKEGSVFPAAMKEIAPWKKKKVDNKFARRHTMPVTLDVELISNMEGFDSAPAVKKIGEIKTPIVPEPELDSIKKSESKEKLGSSKGKDAARKRSAKGKNQNYKKSKSAGGVNAVNGSMENVSNVARKGSSDAKATEMKEVPVNCNLGISVNCNGEVLINGHGEVSVNCNGELPVNGSGEASVNGNGEVSVNYNGEVSVNYNGEVSVNYNGEVSENYNGEVSVNYNREPIVNGNEEASVNYNREPILNGNEEASVNYNGEPMVNGNGEASVKRSGLSKMKSVAINGVGGKEDQDGNIADEIVRTPEVKGTSRLSRLEKYKMQFQSFEKPKDNTSGNRLVLVGAYNEDEVVDLDFGDTDTEQSNISYSPESGMSKSNEFSCEIFGGNSTPCSTKDEDFATNTKSSMSGSRKSSNETESSVSGNFSENSGYLSMDGSSDYFAIKQEDEKCLSFQTRGKCHDSNIPDEIIKIPTAPNTDIVSDSVTTGYSPSNGSASPPSPSSSPESDLSKLENCNNLWQSEKDVQYAKKDKALDLREDLQKTSDNYSDSDHNQNGTETDYINAPFPVNGITNEEALCKFIGLDDKIKQKISTSSVKELYSVSCSTSDVKKQDTEKLNSLHSTEIEGNVSDQMDSSDFVPPNKFCDVVASSHRPFVDDHVSVFTEAQNMDKTKHRDDTYGNGSLLRNEVENGAKAKFSFENTDTSCEHPIITEKCLETANLESKSLDVTLNLSVETDKSLLISEQHKGNKETDEGTCKNVEAAKGEINKPAKLPEVKKEKIRELPENFKELPEIKKENIRELPENFKELPEIKKENIRGLPENFKELPEIKKENIRELPENFKELPEIKKENIRGLPENFKELPEIKKENIKELPENFKELPEIKKENIRELPENFKELPEIKKENIRGLQENFKELPEIKKENIRELPENFKELPEIKKENIRGLQENFKELPEIKKGSINECSVIAEKFYQIVDSEFENKSLETVTHRDVCNPSSTDSQQKTPSCEDIRKDKTEREKLERKPEKLTSAVSKSICNVDYEHKGKRNDMANYSGSNLQNSDVIPSNHNALLAKDCQSNINDYVSKTNQITNQNDKAVSALNQNDEVVSTLNQNDKVVVSALNQNDEVVSTLNQNDKVVSTFSSSGVNTAAYQSSEEPNSKSSRVVSNSQCLLEANSKEKLSENGWEKAVEWERGFTDGVKGRELDSSEKYTNYSESLEATVHSSFRTAEKTTGVGRISNVDFENEVTECQKLRLPTTTSLLCREGIFSGANATSLLLHEAGSDLDAATRLKDCDSTKNMANSNNDSQQIPDIYVAIMDFEPMETDDEAVPMKEGQQVEIVDATKPRRWLVRTMPMAPEEVAREGWVPACYLEKSTAEKALGYIVTEPAMDPKELEARENREAVVNELVETEEDFAKDLQYVVENYYKHLESSTAPKEMRDRKGSIFGNFKDICDFHNNVLIKGVQYHAKEPTKLGKTFLRLERDFDMHASYCWNEARAQQLLQGGPLRDFFDEYSKQIDDDKTLSDHLKLPIQRLNDYQLLLKEIIKYSSRLNEDTSDLQKALDFIHSINKRTKDLQYVQALKGCTGDILKLGRIVKHDLFDVTEGGQASPSERIVFLFKGRVFVTEKRVEDEKESYHVRNLFKLQEVEMVDHIPEDPLQIVFRHTKKGRQGFPLTLRARTQDQKDIWIKEITAGTQAEDLGDQEPALLVTRETPVEAQEKPKPTELKHKTGEAEGHSGEPELKKSKVAEGKSEEAVKEPKKKEESAPQTPTESSKDKKPDFKKQRSIEEKRVKRQSSKEGVKKELPKEDSEAKIPKESEAKPPQKKEPSQADAAEAAVDTAAKPPIPKDQEKGKKQKPGKPGQEGEGDEKGSVDSGVFESLGVIRVMSEDTSDSDARVEVLESMETGEDNATIASGSLRSGSVSPVDGAEMAKKPGFSKTLRGVTCSLGEAVTLECETEGTPAPSVAWLKDNKKITKSKRIETTSKGQKHSLKIKDTTAEDAGLYTVVASNASGSASCSAPLNLKTALLGVPKEDSRPTTPGGTLLPQAPVFKVKLNKETQLLEGTCVRFELVVRGHPEPTVKFLKDNKELKTDDRVRVVYESKEVFELILDHVVASDAGTYSCVATNSEGSDTTVGNLTVTKTKDVFKGLEEELEEEREPSPRPRTPKFKWFKNGQDFEASERFKVMFNEEDDSLALLFQHVTPDDAGLYTCVASTSTGSKIACSAELTVQGVIRQVEAPAIKAELSDVEATEGGSAMLELKITGYPKPKVTWFHKKKEVQSGGRYRFLFADEESFTLVIKSVIKDDAGQYTVKAANEVGEVESSCKLTVKSAPSFVKGLKDMSVMADEVIKFEVEIDGNPAPEVKWYKDGQQLTPSDRIKISSGDKKCTLQVSKAKPGDSGSYSCVLTNSLGSQAEFSNVVVKASPTFIKEMENVEGVESDTLQFNVEVAGNPKPTLKWSKDGKELKVDGKRVKVIEEGANSYSLVIDKATLSDVGVYTCELRNDHGMKASSGNLNLKTKPEFIKKLSDLEATEGDANLELSVSLKGYPSPTTKWSLDGKDIADNKSYVISHDTQTGAHTLRLKKVHRDNSGKYSCEASNTMGTAVTSGVLSVHVPSKKPEFDQSLKPAQLVEGKPGKLEAKVSGEPKPKIKWLKDGKEITPNGHFTVKEEPDGTISLLIDSVTAGDAGTYAIIAESELGEAKCEAPVTTIPAGQKPTFLKELDKVNLMEGQPLKLEAKVTGKPTSIKWQKDGDDLSPSDRIALSEDADGSIALKIDEVNRNDAGKYTVIATNSEGKARSAALVEVKAVSKPEILSNLEPLTLKDGETGQLKAKVSGEPKPTVKWFKDGKELKPSNRIEAAEEPDGVMTLTIKNARPEDAGNYSVVVANVRGEVKNSAPVTVNQAPTFHKPLKAVDVVEGYPAKLEAKVGGSPPPELKWMKDNQEIKPDGVHVKEIRSPDGTVGLLIADCKPEDAGKYSLCLKNPLGEQSSDGNLSVTGKSDSGEPESAPNFLGPIGDVSVKEGEPIRFETVVSGNPLPIITWTFNNEPLKPTDDMLVTFDGKRAILEIKNSKPEHIGTYQCSLSNPLGSASSDGTASVQEKTAPRFTQRLTDFSGCMGKPMKMTCKVKGYPDPEIDWYHNGNRIDAGSKYTVGRAGDLCSLTVNDCKPEDSGVYECKACNPLGEDSTHAEATISDKVEKGEAPIFLKKIGDNEVMEGMTARFTACITGIPTPEIKWTKDGQPLELTPRHKTDLDSTGILRFVVKDVEPSDYGEYNVVISNCHGSATSSARLLPDSLDPKYMTPIGDQFIDFDKFKKTGAPVPLPDKPRIIRMYDKFLTLGWKPSVPHAPRIPVTYQIEMAKHPDGEWSPYKTGLKDTLCDVQDLIPGQDYKFRIRVENKYGVSEPSPYTTAHRSKIYEPIVPADFAPKDFEIEHPPLEKIAAAPRFLRKEEAEMYGVRGHPVTITFWVYGYPEPQISWYKDETKIEKGKYDFLQDRNGKVSVFIDCMSDSYVGTYLCHAVNDEGEARMKIKLHIAEAPVFIQRLDETTGMVRRCGRMQCRVTGLPYPKIKWHRDWHPLYESEKVKILWEEPDICTLFISNLITRDAALYSCSAANLAGSASCSASLNVEDTEELFDIKTYSRPITVKPRSKPFEDFYDLGDELGRGTQGITYHAVKRDTGNSYAAKMMHGKGKLKHFMKNEMDIMNQICHPKLVRLWDTFDTKDSMTLITDICGGGELLDSILRRGTLTEREVAYYIKQLLQGLDHMHGRYIGHLGLTVGDLLVSRANSYDIKVGDFGLAARLIPGKDYFLEYGHPEFVAPEIANKLPATLLSDMWSVGVMTYLLLSGISPFLGEHDRETLTRVQQGKISFSPDAFSGVTEDAKDFMSKLLVFDPSGRMNVKTALQHKWITGYADIPSESDKPLNNIDRLKDYYRRWKDWYANASCRTYYRRRTLESCFHHPSRMIYPPGEEYTPAGSPEPDLERTRVKPSHFDDTYKQKINREEIDFRSESNYQNGPDTYLLQLRDTDFPMRLRQYLRVGARTSPSLAVSLREKHWGDSTLVIRERRKFVDIMDEEIDDERKGLSTRTVPMRLYHEIGTLGYAHEQMELLKKEVWKDKGSRELEIGSPPYFRETLRDTVMREDEKVVFTCYAVGSPKPDYAWFRNDGILLESSRVVVKEIEGGKCVLTINPSRAYDAGVYKCVARNMHGVTVCRARLKMGGKPGRPDAPTIKNLSDTEVYLTWTSPRDEGHSPTLCYALDYKQSDSQEWTSVRNNITHEFFVVRQLIPSTFYQFRVKAMNKFGWGEPGFSTEPISTKEAGAEPIKISIHRKYQQELTESSSEFLPDEIEQADVDYNRENNPVPLIEGDTMELYRIVSEVSRGRFSVVLNVWVKESSTTCIAKVINSTPSKDPNVRQECDILRSLSHEKIVNLLSASFNGQKTVLVMEKLSGIDVLTYLSRRQEYNEEMVIKIIKQVFEAIQYLHFRGICYIELQPDNVVMVDSRHPDIKLVDFGASRVVPKSGGKVEVKGTPEYLAPEVLKNEDVSTLTDVWAVGTLAYILLSGVSPFRGKTDEESIENVTFVRYQFDHLYKEITTEATRFILNVFKTCPIKRPTVAECLENKWLLPSEYMIMKRESARFLPDKLFAFAKEFHSAKADAMDPEMLTSLGMSSSRREIQEVEY